MNETEFTSLRTEVCRTLARRTPNTEHLELLQLVRRFEPKDRHVVRTAFMRYINPERAFEIEGTESAEDTQLTTVFAAMGIMYELHQHFNWAIQEHEAPLMDILYDEALADIAMRPSPEDYG